MQAMYLPSTACSHHASVLREVWPVSFLWVRGLEKFVSQEALAGEGFHALGSPAFAGFPEYGLQCLEVCTGGPLAFLETPLWVYKCSQTAQREQFSSIRREALK